MKLLGKFNLILLLLFGSGLALVSQIAKDFLTKNAEQQVLQQAQLMVESARSTRDYTEEELKPLLETLPQHRTVFLPQTIPFYAATQTFSRLRKTYAAYDYKEATLNPTNLRDRAVDWEADIINYFRGHPDEKELVGQRDTPTGRALYLAHPIAADPPCLECHGTAKDAPPAILKTYGSANGFGWKPHEIVAAQIVSVPMAVPIQIADRAFRNLEIYLVAVFLATLAAVDGTLYWIVIRPVRRLSATADQISKGDVSVPEMPVKGKDEIATLSESFNRMYVSLQKALRLLNE